MVTIGQIKSIYKPVSPAVAQQKLAKYTMQYDEIGLSKPEKRKFTKILKAVLDKFNPLNLERVKINNSGDSVNIWNFKKPPSQNFTNEIEVFSSKKDFQQFFNLKGGLNNFDSKAVKDYPELKPFYREKYQKAKAVLSELLKAKPEEVKIQTKWKH